MKQLTPPVFEGDNTFGSPDARIELVEYGDYECPYCGRAYPIVKGIQEHLGSDLKFTFRNFPLAKIHPNAFNAALATEAAALQGKFWEMHDIIFENQLTLSSEYILELARVIGLDVEELKESMQQDRLNEKVKKDFESGLRSGVNRTPTFFVNGEKFDGMFSGDQLLQFLKKELVATLIP